MRLRESQENTIVELAVPIKGQKQQSFEEQDLVVPSPLSPPKRTPSREKGASPLRTRNESFNRLYQNGMQSKQRLAQAVVDGQITKSQQEIEDCLDVPRISEISSAVAEALPARQQRKNGAAQFQHYSEEWQKVRDAKIDEARKQILQKEAEFFKPKINRAHLPENYKGPISGYYAKVNRYFGKKEILNHMSK